MASGENLVDVIAVVEIDLKIIFLICILCLNQSGETENDGDQEIFRKKEWRKGGWVGYLSLIPPTTCLK
jgi:hypothetical protein